MDTTINDVQGVPLVEYVLACRGLRDIGPPEKRTYYEKSEWRLNDADSDDVAVTIAKVWTDQNFPLPKAFLRAARLERISTDACGEHVYALLWERKDRIGGRCQVAEVVPEDSGDGSGGNYSPS